jgi:hypothetical protein
MLAVLLSFAFLAEAATKDALGFRFASFSRDDRVKLIMSGSANIVPPRVVLTTNVTGQEGGVVWNSRRVFVNEFICNFSFFVTSSDEEGGDGVALVFYVSKDATFCALF